jgi:hypothetical protein
VPTKNRRSRGWRQPRSARPGAKPPTKRTAQKPQWAAAAVAVCGQAGKQVAHALAGAGGGGRGLPGLPSTTQMSSAPAGTPGGTVALISLR